MSNSEFKILDEDVENTEFSDITISSVNVMEYILIILCIIVLMRIFKIVSGCFCQKTSHQERAKDE